MKKYFYFSLFLFVMLSIWAADSAATAHAARVTGAFIDLQVEPFQQDLWTRIQWQDASGSWHDIEGWQGAFNPNQRVLWYVGEAHLGDGPFRWLVFENQQGDLLAMSQPFTLPSRGGEVLRVVVTLPSAVATTHTNVPARVPPVVATAVLPPTPCGNPHPPDPNTLLLLLFDNTYEGAQGETGSPTGTTFTTGKYGQGVAFNATDTLTYATADNLTLEQGAIEFWLRPNWDGNDGKGYVFFEVGDDWFNRLRIMKDEANNLRFMSWDSDTEYGVATNIAHWQAGDWHHVAASWAGTQLTLFVDCEAKDSTDTAYLPEGIADTIYIGSSSVDALWADAVMDELRITSVPFHEANWIINPNNSHAYRMILCGSWQQCESAAADQGAYLVAINNELEQMWLLDTFGGAVWFWIGFTDQESEGDWRWSNGEAVTYTNWDAGEPNNAWECGEDYGVLNYEEAGQWNDLGPCLPEWEFVTWAVIEKSP